MDMREVQMQVLENKIARAVRDAYDWSQTSSAWLWLYFNEDSITGPDGSYVAPEEKILQWVEAKGLDLLGYTTEDLTGKVRAYLGAWARRAKQLTLAKRVEDGLDLPTQPAWPDMLDEMREAEVQARRGVRRRVGIQPAPSVEPNTRLVGDVAPSEFYGDFYIWVAEHIEDLGKDRAERVRRMAQFAVDRKEAAEAPPQQAGHHKDRQRSVRVSYDNLVEAAQQADWTIEDERLVGVR